MGSIDDYLDEFDAQIAKLTEKLNKDAQYWADQEGNLANKNAAVPARMHQLMEEFKKSFVREIFEGQEEIQAPAFDITKFPLKDIERFGN